MEANEKDLRQKQAAFWLEYSQQLSTAIRYAEALAVFERALVLDPKFVPAWDGKAWVLGILGHKVEALTAIDRALELDPDYFEAVKRKKRLEVL